MNDTIDDDDELEELTIERFNKTFDILSNRPGAKYNFIKKIWTGTQGCLV